MRFIVEIREKRVRNTNLVDRWWAIRDTEQRFTPVMMHSSYPDAEKKIREIARELNAADASLMEVQGKPSYMTRDIIATLRMLADHLELQQVTIDEFHAYAHRFGGTPGCDVFQFCLEDALRFRGMTLEQLKAEATR